MPEIGDRVHYLPGSEQAFLKGQDGTYPWAIGLKRYGMVGNKVQEIVDELSHKQLDEYLDFLHRCPDPTAERKRIVFLRPKVAWPAVVTEILENGNLALEVQSSNTGVTLHYASVPEDRTLTRGHSWHDSIAVASGHSE